MERMNPWLVGLLTAVGLQSLVIGGFLYSARSQKPEAAKPGQAATSQSAKSVAKAEAVKGSNLKRLTLTARAAERLDIKTAQVRTQQVVRKRSVEGEVLAPPEGTVVTAPVAGIISLPEGAGAAAPGTKLSAGQTVLRLTATSSEAPQASAVRLASTAAQAPRPGRQAAVPQPATPTPEATFLSLPAPRDSHLLRLHVQPGQVVEAGQPLFEVADVVGTLVRVPLAGDVNKVAREKPARVLPFNAKDGASGRIAQATPAPHDADPKEAAKALYYLAEATGQELAPGQRVRVDIHLAGSGKQRLTVPYGAVIYDPYGDAWVYTNPEPLVFVRHRINVDYIEGDLAVLSDGPPAGTAVVMAGASELFGAEHKAGY